MVITVNVEIFDGCLISFFSSLDSTHEIKYIRGCTTTISHTYVNITDENLCARNLRIVGLVQKVRNFDALKISTFTVCLGAHAQARYMVVCVCVCVCLCLSV